jgi:hypothetical protein
MTKGTQGQTRASKKEALFDPKKEAKQTINFIGMCLHNPMTPEAEKNINKYLETVLNLAYKTGDRDGYKQGYTEVMEAWKKSNDIIYEK